MTSWDPCFLWLILTRCVSPGSPGNPPRCGRHGRPWAISVHSCHGAPASPSHTTFDHGRGWLKATHEDVYGRHGTSKCLSWLLCCFFYQKGSCSEFYMYIYVYICTYAGSCKLVLLRLYKRGWKMLSSTVNHGCGHPFVKHIICSFVIFLHPRLQFRHWNGQASRNYERRNKKSTLVSFFFDVIFAKNEIWTY